jgi:DNA-binding Lrp family transcriptional regulator
MPLDDTDRALLAALQRDARTTNKELAAGVGLAPSSCLARVRKLEADGLIEGYTAKLRPDRLGFGLQALISVQLRLHVSEAFNSIGDHLRSLPEAAAVYCLGGSIDFLVHVVCRDTEHLRKLTIHSFTSRPEVSRIETALVYSFARLGMPIEDPPLARADQPREPRRASRRASSRVNRARPR